MGNLALILAGQIAANLQGLIVLPIIIRMAGEGVYGAYVLLLNLLFVLVALMDTTATYGYKRRLVSATDMAERRRLFEPQFTIQLAALVALSAAILLWAAPLEDLLFAGTAVFAPWLAAALLACFVLDTWVASYFRFTRRLRPIAMTALLRPVVFLGLLAALALARGSLSLDGLLLVQVASSLALTLPYLALMLREIALPRLRLPLRPLARDMRMGLPLTLEFLGDLVLGFGDRYLICIFMSIAAVGQYQPAYQVASLLILLPRIAGNMLKPTLFAMVDAGAKTEAETLVAQLLQLFLMLAIPFAAGALMMGPSLVRCLTTPEVAEASRAVAPLVALGSIFYGVTILMSLAAFVLARTGTILGAGLLGAALNLGLNLALLPLFGDLAVPAATTLAGYGASCFYVGRALRPLWRMAISTRAVARFLLASAVMTAFLWLAGLRPAAVSDMGAPALAGLLAAAVGVYLVSLWAAGGLGRREVSELRGLLLGRALAARES